MVAFIEYHPTVCYVGIAEMYRSFRKFCFPHHETTLMMEAAEPSETVVLFCWVTGFISQKTAVFFNGKSFGAARAL
jgi:hypothetical protein